MKLEERRAHFRKGLSTLYIPHYDALCGLLGPEWQPYCGLRTFDEQTALYMVGRTKGKLGAIVTRARSGESPHNYGCASDWTIWDLATEKPIWITAKDPRWKEYQQAIEKVRLKWGADWNRNGRTDDEHFLDFPHNELSILADWRHIGVTYSKNGMRAAQEHIELALDT